jgi:hypothetical protein
MERGLVINESVALAQLGFPRGARERRPRQDPALPRRAVQRGFGRIIVSGKEVPVILADLA